MGVGTYFYMWIADLSKGGIHKEGERKKIRGWEGERGR